MTARLVRPDVAYRESYLEAMDEHLESEDDWREDAARLSDFDAYVEFLLGQSSGLGLPPGHVPCTVLWLVDGERYLGRVNLRHELTEWLRSFGGHIGYFVRPTERRKGFATLALREALLWAKRIGLVRVLVTCDESNLGSRKVIEANGGEYENSVERTRRYWFTI